VATYWTRKRAAAAISAEYFEVAERTLINWTEVKLVYLNGKAHAPEADWRAAASRRLAEMLANQGQDLAVLQSAKRANAATAEIRERKRQAAEKLRAGKRRGKAGEATLTT
jgi:hypothetical protein